MDAGKTGGCGIQEPSKDLFVIERVYNSDDEQDGGISAADSKIVATACVWTTPNKTKKTLIERNGAKVVVAMPSTV